MKKTILIIGVIALFVGLSFVPAVANVKTEMPKSVQQKNKILPDYSFISAKIELTSGKCLAWGGALWFRFPPYPECVIAGKSFVVLGGMIGGVSKFELKQELAPGVITITPVGKSPLTITTDATIKYGLFIGEISENVGYDNLETYLNGKAFHVRVWLN